MDKKSYTSDFAGSASLISGNIDMADEIISEKETSEVKNLTDLWILAKITHDTIGNPILDYIRTLTTDLRPIDKKTYTFDYCGYQYMYFSRKDSCSLSRIAIPRLVPVGKNNESKLAETVNLANTMVGECKFIIIGGEVWIIHERCCEDEKKYILSLESILEQLKSGAELFHSMI